MRKKRTYKIKAPGAYAIPKKNKDLIEEVFIRQLRSMGMTSEEIKKELQKLIP
jgi:hypothetical protein